jgi:hypothetical protein
MAGTGERGDLLLFLFLEQAQQVIDVILFVDNSAREGRGWGEVMEQLQRQQSLCVCLLCALPREGGGGERGDEV